MRYSTDKSWYDYDSDSLVFPDARTLSKPAEALANRHNNVVMKVIPDETRWTFFDDFFGWIGDLWRTIVSANWSWPLSFFLCCLLGVIIFFIVRNFNLESFGARKASVDLGTDNTNRDQTRIVDLPFQIHSLKTDLWTEVLRLRDAGELSKAIVYLYGHALVELDAANCIRLQRGKTNRTYVRELSPRPDLYELQNQLMNRFEAVFFGRHSIGLKEFDECLTIAADLKSKLLQTKSDEKDTKAIAKPGLVASDKNALGGSTLRLWLLMGFYIASTSMIGCGSRSVGTDEFYGEASAYGTKQSVAGLSSFRALCEKNGQTSIQLNGLSLRSRQLDTIVFAPKGMRLPTTSEIKWFEEWLAEYPNRTLVFIGRDFSPATRYWQRAVETLKKSDRSVFAQEKSQAETSHETLRWKQDQEMECSWFRQDTKPLEVVDGTNVSGFWRNEAASKDTGVPDIHVPLRAYLNRASTDSAFEGEVLLASKDRRPILFFMKSDGWYDGKLYVFANGSILLNEGMTYPGHRQLAQNLISKFASKGRIGFLSPQEETPIKSDLDAQEASGFELLRVWPLSLISIQALFLGFMVLLALFPIFGRPQRLAAKSRADFGLHIEALGQLLQKSQDKKYALHQIASYFRDVKGEPNNHWSQIAPPSKEFPHVPAVTRND